MDCFRIYSKLGVPSGHVFVPILIADCSNWLPTKPEFRVCDLFVFLKYLLDLFGDAALPAHSFMFLQLWFKLPDLCRCDFAEPWLRQRPWCRKQLQLEWVHWQSRSFPVSHPVVPHGAGQWMCLQMLASLVSRVLPLVPLVVQLRPTSLALWCQIQGWAAMWAPSICNAQILMEDHRTLFPWRAHASTVKLLLQNTTKLPTLSHGLRFPLARPPVHPQVARWWDVLWQRLWQGWQCKKLESSLLLACLVFRSAQCAVQSNWRLMASCSPKMLNSLQIFANAYSRQYASIPDLRPFSIFLVGPGHTMGFRGISWATLHLGSKTWASKMDKRITLKLKGPEFVSCALPLLAGFPQRVKEDWFQKNYQRH